MRESGGLKGGLMKCRGLHKGTSREGKPARRLPGDLVVEERQRLRGSAWRGETAERVGVDGSRIVCRGRLASEEGIGRGVKCLECRVRREGG